MPPGRPRRIPHTHRVILGIHVRMGERGLHTFDPGDHITPTPNELLFFGDRFEVLDGSEPSPEKGSLGTEGGGDGDPEGSPEGSVGTPSGATGDVGGA